MDEVKISKTEDGRLRVERSRLVVDEEEFEYDEQGLFLKEPRCGCGMSAIQQKCPWERGGDCSRHEVADLFEMALKADATTHSFHERFEGTRVDGVYKQLRTGNCWDCPFPNSAHLACRIPPYVGRLD